MQLDKKKKIMTILCLIYGLWHLGTQWTTTLLSFIQWDTVEVLTIVDLGYIQSFGSLMNAIGALAIGQMTDTIGPKTMFIVSTVLTSLYYICLSVANRWWAFFILQIFRVGYNLDSTAEMYLATITTESERTASLMILSIPQAIALFVGPMIGSKVAVFTTLRTSQFIAGVFMSAAMIPVVLFLLPTTHSIPKLASAKLRPQEYLPLIKRNAALREGVILRGLIVGSYVCYELIGRNFLLRAYMKGSNESAEVLMVMGASLLIVQFIILPLLQKRYSPKTLLQIAIIAQGACYASASYTTSLNQYLLITFIQTGAYAVCYAETCTMITSSVGQGELGKATGFGFLVQWFVHFIVPIYTSHLVNSWHYTYAFYSSAIVMSATLAYVTFGCNYINARTRSLLPSLMF